MLTASSRFTAAERADANQIAAKAYLILGNYANSSAFGATVSASGSDGSGNYPAAGAIDGDRTELNVGAASGADNDVGLSSWRSAVAPSVTPQTLTIDFGQSRTINRIKLYHLSSHGLSSYKLESSPDNSTYTLIAKTTDQGGTITTTSQLDTIDFTDVACRYVKLTIANTVVAADKANVVEIECYRKVEITSRVTNLSINRDRDYKLGNPLASTFSLTVDNSDKFFSFSYSPTAAEITSGFVNSELGPNIQVLLQLGFAYGGAAAEVISVLTGFVDRIRPKPKSRTAVIEGRDGMKTLINQVVSSKLQASQDIKACIQYALNQGNISNWEMDLDTTSITVDYFFLNNQSLITAIRDLVQATGDAAFWFDETGVAKFRSYLNSTPGQHIDTSQADFQAGTVKTNIDTDSVPGRIGRKWFLIDSFTDGEFFVNPVWSNHAPTSSATDTTEADFELATVATNIDTTSTPDQFGRKWFLIDDFADGQFSTNPIWTDRQPGGGAGSAQWNASGGTLKWTSNGSTPSTPSEISTPFAQTSGTWRMRMKFGNVAGGGSNLIISRFVFMANRWIAPTAVSGFSGFMNGYTITVAYQITNPTVGLLFIQRIESTGALTTLTSASIVMDNAFHSYRVTRDAAGVMNVYFDEVLKLTTTDATVVSNAMMGCSVSMTSNPLNTIEFDDFYYSMALDGTGTITSAQSVFESRAIDQSAPTSEGSLTVNATIPSGCSLAYFTATSADGLSWDAYVAVSGTPIQSTPRRYIKYKIVMTTPNDNGVNADLTTATIQDVAVSWTTVGWAIVSHQMQFAPLTSSVRQGVDTPLAQMTGTWRTLITMTPGTSTGHIARLYFMNTGYDTPSNTYLGGYYAEVSQAAGALSLYKINSSGTRTLLATTAQAINSSQHSLRVTRTSAGALELFWDEVSKVTATDTAFSNSTVLGFEVDPNGDQNGTSKFDDVYYSPMIDGTGAVTSAIPIFESQVIDMSASVATLGLFATTVDVPTGCTLTFYTATSADGITFDAYVAATSGAAIPSTVHRYIKWKVTMTAPIDDGLHNAVFTTPQVFDVTLNWFTAAGSNKFPTSVSYTFRFDSSLLDIEQEISDNLGGDSAIINDVTVQAKPLVKSGADTDVQWQGTTQTPPVPISVSAPLNVTNGQTLTYYPVISGGMDTSRMSGASPAAAAITFTGGGAGTWVFSRIHPTQPVLVITITGTGSITNLQLQGKAFSASTAIVAQNSNNAASVKRYGDRLISISNQYIVNSAIAAQLAAKLVANFKDPTNYIPSCQVRPTWSIQLGDRCTIVDDNSALSGDYIAAGVTHDLAANLDSAEGATGLLLLKVTT